MIEPAVVLVVLKRDPNDKDLPQDPNRPDHRQDLAPVLHRQHLHHRVHQEYLRQHHLELLLQLLRPLAWQLFHQQLPQ
jgi:hypothetical protein